MEPPYQIPLTDSGLKMIGEVCVLQGQIEWLMQSSFKRVSGLPDSVTRKVLGSTNLQVNLQIWIDILYHYRFVSPHVPLDWAEIAIERANELIGGRNDFIHGIFGHSHDFDTDIGTYSFFHLRRSTSREKHDVRPAMMKSRTGEMKPLEDLATVRDRAAGLAVIMAHIEHCATAGAPSPWQETLGRAPQPRSATAAARLAQAQAAQPRS